MSKAPAPSFLFSTARDQPQATHLLVYMAQKLRQNEKEEESPGASSKLDFVSATRLGRIAQWDYDTDEPSPHSFELGMGAHSVWYKGRVLSVDVSVAVSDSNAKVFTYEQFSSVSINKQISITGLQDQGQMTSLMKEASSYVSSLLRLEQNGRRNVANLVFDAKERRFTRIGHLQHRDLDSLFLKEMEREKLFGLITDFLDSKDDYMMCSVPYKLNLLMYGLPGSGKTSVIKAIASHFGLNVAIIPFSPLLTDDALAHALISASRLGCSLIALEDVDCVFNHDRKPGDAAASSLTLSGLLNCMDGMLRGSSDGLVMVLTANTVAEIDEAVLRTARMDYALEFTHADKHQTRACFAFYAKVFGHDFTDAEWDAFWDGIACQRYTTALLQQFFFQARRDRAAFLDVDRFRRILRAAGKDAMQPEGADGAIYT